MPWRVPDRVRIATSKAAPAAIDKALRVLGHEGELTALQRLPNTARLFGPRELTRLIAELRRNAPDGPTTREVTRGIIRLKGRDGRDVRFERALREKVGRTLWKRKRRGAVCSDKRGGENVWRGA